MVEDGLVDHLQGHPHPPEVDGSADPGPIQTQQDHQLIQNNNGDPLHRYPDQGHPLPYPDLTPLVVEVL